ncbi:MAG: ABC transporter permease [Candidatus Bathyarchaeota archaeon]|nr:ABC transporter permease [Candidatus Bathyarchaeota archaeon]
MRDEVWKMGVGGKRSILQRLNRWKTEHEAQLEDFSYSLHLLRQSPLSMVGLVIISALILIAVFAPYLAQYDPIEQDLPNRLQAPCREHPFGRDQLGRDMLSRILHGSRISLMIGIIVVSISATTGTFLGVVAGYLGGRIDEIVMRVTDMFLAFPSLILAMAISAALGRSLENTVIAIGMVAWPRYARLARGQALSVKEAQFIEAVRSLGASRKRIIFSHVLPQCLPPIIIQATLGMGGIILTAAGLGFIGFGAQPPTPEWGIMISDGRNFIMREWWVSTFPGLAMLLVVLGFNLLGDGLRDVLDPRLRR